MRPLFVLDTETTGLMGAPEDSIVEVGVARVDLRRGKVYPEYSRIINAPLTEDQYAHAWVFEHTDLKPEDCRSSPYFVRQVANELMYLYSGEVFTAYNVEYDFDKFLKKDPWYFEPTLAPCIMKSCAEILAPDGRWLRAQEAYDRLCPDNPADLPGGVEQHRALSDAICEGWILIRLLEGNPAMRTIYESLLEDF